MKCPVCDKIHTSMVCPKCGFDSSRDYGRYPTFGVVGKVPAVSALRREWEQKQDQKETVVTPVPPAPEPPRKKTPWLAIAACAVAMVLGIGIGAGLGGGEPIPTEPKDTVQMQKPPETILPPETTTPPLWNENTMDAWQDHVLRADELPLELHRQGEHLAPVFGSGYQRQDIRSITFVDTLADMASDAWDVSEYDNGKVMAWVVPNGELYDLYIGAEGGIRAGISCEDLFTGYANVERISFNGVLNTSNTQDMSNMFSFSGKFMTELDLSSFDTSNVRDMYEMFSGLGHDSIDNPQFELKLNLRGCDALTELDLSNFDTSNTLYMDYMFYMCMNLRDLKLGTQFVTTNATTDDMFTRCPAGADYQHLVR